MLIKKIGCFILLFTVTSIGHVNANNIEINGRNITIKQAFIEIERQSGYTIAYNQSKVDVNIRKDFEISNIGIESAMLDILSETDYSYKIAGKHILVFPIKKDIEAEEDAEEEKKVEEYANVPELRDPEVLKYDVYDTETVILNLGKDNRITAIKEKDSAPRQ